MMIFTRSVLSVLLAGLLAMPAMAVPYNFGGDVTLNTSAGSTLGVAGGIAYGTHNTFLFQAPQMSINASECGGPCGISFDRTLSGTFSAAPGRIITSLGASVIYGPSSTIMNSHGLSDMTWTVGGDSYTGSLSDGGSFATHAYQANWSVTGPNTGQAHSVNGWNSGAIFGGGFSLAPYSINATTFTLDISHYGEMGTLNGGGYFGPLGFGVTVFTAAAPPPPANSAPLPSSMAIIGLGLAGLCATQRRKAA